MNSRDCPKWRACLHEVSLKRGVGAGAGGAGGRGPGSGGPKPGAGSIFFLGLGLVSTLTLTLKQRSLKRRDLDSGTGPDTFRSDLEGYYWVVRKRQTQDELRL